MNGYYHQAKKRFEKTMARVKAWKPKILKVWRQGGYYACVGVLLLMLGVVSDFYRSREKLQIEDKNTSQTAVQENALAVNALPTAQPQPTPQPARWMMPVSGEVLLPFCADELVWNDVLCQWQIHAAVDISAMPGEAVISAADGEVIWAGEDAALGFCAQVRHDGGVVITYASLNAMPMVNTGDEIDAGQVIGSAGTSAAGEAGMGTHVHVAVEVDGEAADFMQLIHSGA